MGSKTRTWGIGEAEKRREGTLYRDGVRAEYEAVGQSRYLWVQICFLPSSGLVPSAVLIVAKKCPG